MLSAIDERPPIFIPFGVRVHAGMRSLEGQVHASVFEYRGKVRSGVRSQ